MVLLLGTLSHSFSTSKVLQRLTSLPSLVAALSPGRTGFEFRKGELLCWIASSFTIQVSIELSRHRHLTRSFCLWTFGPICNSTSDIRNFSDSVSRRYVVSESPSNLCHYIHRSPRRSSHRSIDDSSESYRSCCRSLPLSPKRQAGPPRIPFRMLTRIHSILATSRTSRTLHL